MNSAPPKHVRVRAWVGTIVFLFLAPVAIVAGALILGGIVVLLDAFVRFARADGTPAPPVPTAHLVVVGPYRFVRNPMYVAVVSIILGQALLFGSWWTLAYAVVAMIVVALFVRFYEQPTLERTYGDEYRTYRANVRAWLPRLRPWTPSPSRHGS